FPPRAVTLRPASASAMRAAAVIRVMPPQSVHVGDPATPGYPRPGSRSGLAKFWSLVACRQRLRDHPKSGRTSRPCELFQAGSGPGLRRVHHSFRLCLRRERRHGGRAQGQHRSWYIHSPAWRVIKVFAWIILINKSWVTNPRPILAVAPAETVVPSDVVVVRW